MGITNLDIENFRAFQVFRMLRPGTELTFANAMAVNCGRATILRNRHSYIDEPW